jgi:hypothetical protein
MAGAIEVGEGLLAETFAHLRACGDGRAECVVYLTGPLDDPGSVDRVHHPRHSASPSAYEVDTGWLNEFWLALAEGGRALGVQVHTHKHRAFHSATDDGFAVVQTAGFLSLVIPDFALGPVGLEGAYLAEVTVDGCWAELEPTGGLRVVAA